MSTADASPAASTPPTHAGDIEPGSYADPSPPPAATVPMTRLSCGFVDNHFTPSLQHFFRALHDEDVIAIEWGTGLSYSMGAPIFITDHIVVVPLDQYPHAQGIALSSGLVPGLPEYNPYGIVGKLATWYSVPDKLRPVTLEPCSLLVLSSEHVPIDTTRVSFWPSYNIWRPDHIEAIRSYIHVACFHSDPKDVMSTNWVEMWISEFVLYAICGVKYIPKDTYEGEDYEDPAWERDGLAHIDTLPWTTELEWLRTTLRRLVKGEMRYEFKPDWWEKNVTGAEK